ncbi:putative inositol 5-phosphatase [Aspergillus fischeri NRRL 181]|uniref:Inositol 5-phosphatase, putative n=1 Tax=Neosartorya fischeri (strain ATCC 1020 / DSM 3700 / CBS 544.65 / FGSC A1164 / JCM 1740 / NRRL 181 / WB 181) TaxID=331117 RepID=A1DF67_NEOFI|nr:inositol 5-phosphatase, putative [Aspergillus fischeri NRRL 181]EAW18024.1 inositol 5-phosphatase, putative [Aspergillus fischeri NRRL 181]KAG2016738.1 hypothetical protein GB937_006218 [Aspergillus fischeri]
MDNLTLYILTFNCARNPIDIDLFASHFFHALPHTVPSAPHLIALSLQELAPIAYAFLGGSYLTPYFTSFRQVVARAAASRWEDAQYVPVVEDHVGMTGLMVFARSDVVGKIASVQTAGVGLGLQQMGNKGAVGARLGWMSESESESESETVPVPLTFVAAHLAPAEDAFERRNEDWRAIVERLVLSTATTTNQEEDSESAALLGSSRATGEGEGEGVFTAGYLFLAGDLNYRTSNTLPQAADFARFPSLDAGESDPLHYSRLLREDQLIREREKDRCFHGLSEAPISFPPTYKYKLGARDPREWKFVHSRWPSWCDRILYLESSTATVTPYRYDALPLFPSSDHRAVALAAAVVLRSVQAGPSDSESAPATDVQQPQPAAPFPIDRDWKRKRDEARRKELVVGGLAYLGLTWEGRRYLVGIVIGGLGAWLMLRSMLSV